MSLAPASNLLSKQAQPVLTPAPTLASTDASEISDTNTGSESSTLINADSYSGSTMTLLPDTSTFVYDFLEDPITQLKESIRYTSPILRSITPVTNGTMSPRAKQLPFAPEDLTRALIAVQVCT